MTRDPTTPAGNGVFLLIDSAQFPTIWRILQYRFRRLPWLSLFEDTSDEDVVRSGPVLIQVLTNQTKTIAWFLEHTQDIFGLSWLLSPLSLIALRGHLGGLMQVDAADGSECTMRFFDTRILPVWHDVLSYEQKLHAFGPMVTWSFLNRDGMESTLKGYGESHAPASKNLRLSQSQEQALLDAALPDVIIQQLENSENAELAAIPHYLRRPFIADQVAKARNQYRIQSLPEIVLFCSLALSIGRDFDQLQPVAQVLQNFASEKASLNNLNSSEPFGNLNIPTSLLGPTPDSINSSESNQRA